MEQRKTLAEAARKFWIRSFILTIAIAAGAIYYSSIASAQNGLYVYPLKNQNAEKQDRDRYECHRWAVQQTGFDPSLGNPGNSTALDPQPYRPSQPHVLRGAARGTALGAVGGAIGGNAGKGAAAGAAMGGLAGGFRRRDEQRQYAAQRQAQASASASEKANYQRAMAACLEGRGYSVK